MTRSTVNPCSNALHTINIDGDEVPGKLFTDRHDLNCVNMLEGIRSIGFRSFQGCENIQSIKLPKTTKEVDGYAFSNCKSAKTVSLNDGLVKICHRAFMGCKSVVEVEIPASLKFLGKDSFRGCTSLKEARFLGCPADIKKNVFRECTNLERIVSMSDDAAQIEGMIPKGITMKRVDAKDGWTLVYERVQEPTTNAESESEAPVVAKESKPALSLDSFRLEQAIAEASLEMNYKLTMAMNNKVSKIENECQWLFETIQNKRDGRNKECMEAELAEYQRAFNRKLARLHRVTAARDELQGKIGTVPQ